MAIRALRLGDDVAWAAFSAFLSQRQANKQIVPNLIRHLRAIGVVSAIVEEDYIDRDFSDSYSAYYAKTFRRHSKLCTRVLFFASDLSFMRDDDGNARDQADRLEAQAYIGELVLRPISRAPLALALIKPPSPPLGYEADLLVRAVYKAHVLGAELSVEAAPMTQQDSRVGACAQATIWAAGRHFHVRHRGPWMSMVSVTQSAVAATEHATNLHVPAGSEFLMPNNMVAALRAAGRETLLYAQRPEGAPPNQTFSWGAIRPADVIDRYVDSGIPVILGLSFKNQLVGHAVIVTGHVLRAKPRTSPLPPSPSFGEYSEAFFVNDDQAGPNLRMPIASNSVIAETSYSLQDNLSYLMIPLPTKVYLPAENADAIAWDAIKQYAADWPAFKARYPTQLGSSEALGDALVAQIHANGVIARTYLTFGWRYKHRGIRNKFSNPVRQIIRNLEVPRFVYVTEFSDVDDLTGKTKYERRVIAHAVIDATAKHQDLESILLLHAPGFCAWRAHNSTGQFRQSVAPVENSTTYYPKVRGEESFKRFEDSDGV